MRRRLEELEEEEELEKEEVPPPPPKKAMISEILGEEAEEKGIEEMDRLDLPEPDEEF